MRRHSGRHGSAMLEFVLAGIPLIFIWISIFQMAVGMWEYHTMQYAVKTAGYYLTEHGSDCSTSPNNCAIQIKNVAQVLQSYLMGLPASSVYVTLSVLGSDHQTVASSVSCWLSSCLTNTTAWPPAGYNSPGTDIEIQTEYLWQSALGMVAPGPGSGAVRFGTFWLPGFTHQTILF
jgi:Flp pilus assembly protein TadG